MKKVLCLLVACSMVLGMGGCAPKKKEVLRVGSMPVAVGVPLQYAYDQGWFKDAGLDVEIVMFQTGATVNEAMAAKELDVSVIGTAAVFAMANDVVDWIGEGCIAGGCGIYARPGSDIIGETGNVPDYPDILGSQETVRGKQFLVPLGTSAEYNVIKYLEKFDLTAADVSIVQMDYGPGLQALLSDQGDALAAGPPFTFQAADAGAVCIATYEDATDSALVDGIVARKGVTESRKDDIIKFLEIYYKALDVLAKDESIRFDVSMDYYNNNGISYNDELLNQEISVKKFITTDMIKAPDYVFGKGLRDMAQFYTRDGKVQTEDIPNVIGNMNTSFLDKALGVTVNKVQE